MWFEMICRGDVQDMRRGIRYAWCLGTNEVMGRGLDGDAGVGWSWRWLMVCWRMLNVVPKAFRVGWARAQMEMT